MKKLKGWNKLILQIAMLSATMILLSFFTETDPWKTYFNTSSVTNCYNTCPEEGILHYHWNYRGWVYVLTGVVYFIIASIRIVLSHKEEDFVQ